MELTCPVCHLTALFHGMPEYRRHRRMCAAIELGLLVGPVTPEPVPEVDAKPPGYKWWNRD